MKKTASRARRNGATSRSAELDPTFASIVEAFLEDPRVTYGGQGFGSRALRLDGKIFAMLSSRGQFVVKLPRDRVAELVRMGKAEYFDTGRNVVMKEWVAVLEGPASWRPLSQEAREFAKAKKRGHP